MKLEPGVLVPVAVAAGWYARGLRTRPLRLVGTRSRRPDAVWRPLAFYCGLLAIVVALVPLDHAADELFWAHMVQHVLLMLVAAPLLVLGAPWLPFWRPLPLRFRRAVARSLVKSPRLGWLRAFARTLSRPIVAWILFNGDLLLWHVPWFFNLTLASPAIHYAEHASFVAFGMLFWAQVIDSPPFHCRLDHLRRAMYVTAGATASWLLAVVLALAPSPLYSAYTSLPSRPGGISALTDQQLAGGVMWGPGSITYGLIVFWAIYRWLGEEELKSTRRSSRSLAARGL
jgi:putative membrane protein